MKFVVLKDNIKGHANWYNCSQYNRKQLPVDKQGHWSNDTTLSITIVLYRNNMLVFFFNFLDDII